MNGDDYTVQPAAHGRVVSIGRKRAERFALDFATWRAHLAAPGSRFASARPPSPPIVHLDTVSRAATATASERRTA